MDQDLDRGEVVDLSEGPWGVRIEVGPMEAESDSVFTLRAIFMGKGVDGRCYHNLTLKQVLDEWVLRREKIVTSVRSVFNGTLVAPGDGFYDCLRRALEEAKRKGLLSLVRRQARTLIEAGISYEDASRMWAEETALAVMSG